METCQNLSIYRFSVYVFVPLSTVTDTGGAIGACFNRFFFTNKTALTFGRIHIRNIYPVILWYIL